MQCTRQFKTIWGVSTQYACSVIVNSGKCSDFMSHGGPQNHPKIIDVHIKTPLICYFGPPLFQRILHVTISKFIICNYVCVDQKQSDCSVSQWFEWYRICGCRLKILSKTYSPNHCVWLSNNLSKYDVWFWPDTFKPARWQMSRGCSPIQETRPIGSQGTAWVPGHTWMVTPGP